ncbi:MAG: hypothetical protein QOJ35_2995 [Solirubrobacteraceae bacterium]|nr:hypothetical protein [Solirubrobacteraceae bacterium]
MAFVARLLLLAGAAGMALSALLPWVTIGGRLGLDLGLIGAKVTLGSRTVSGTETSLWPAIVGVAAVVAALAVVNVGRNLLLVLGLVVVAGGGALLYYAANVVDIEAGKRDPIQRALADALISSSVGPGPALLLAAGIAIVTGALLAR